MDNRVPQGIGYLEGLAPWSGSFSSEWSLNLMRQLMARLGDPQDQIPAIHVTGTNGKGSVSVAVASILAQGGRKIGLTTSPHLKRINERIVIDGSPISDELLNWCGIEVERAARALGEPPTFFEGITAAAFLAFRESKVDFSVVEVGLGGRLDATNVLSAPKVSVIVTIDFDHEQLLGSTLGEIAREKAGIIKPGVPVVSGALGDEACFEVNGVAKLSGSMIKSFGADFKVALSDTGGCRYTDDGGGFDFSPSLKGEHQAHNMAVAIAVARIVGATVEECQRGVSGLYWPGRLESLSFEGREVIIDAAHNPAGISSLIAFLKSRDIRPQIAFGAIETKNWRGMVESLAPYVGDWLIMEPDFPKAVPAREIVAFLSGFGITARSFGGDYGAFTEELRGGSNPFLVCGSIYLIGIVRDLMCGGGSVLWEPVGR